jgi:MFS family permease
MIDRLGTRLGYGLCVAWWSIAAAMHAFARGTFSLGVFRFLLGIGEAGNWPGAVKVVAEWFPEKERALAAGLFNSGSAVGAILAPPIVAYLILHFGWQSAFAFVGLAGLVWLVFWFTMYHSSSTVGDASWPQLVDSTQGDASQREILVSRLICKSLKTVLVICISVGHDSDIGAPICSFARRPTVPGLIYSSWITSGWTVRSSSASCFVSGASMSCWPAAGSTR